MKVIAGAVAVIVALFLLVNWQTVYLVFAVIFSDKRPALLRDADWDDPASAVRFRARFAAGTPEQALVAWLEKSRFVVDARARKAQRPVEGLPCNENITVRWSADGQARLTRADAVVHQIACL
ncbi:MAG: hypothetical protein QM608_13235 [Caulobacter sp.]